MRAVVLVGGEGLRLRPLTADTPKQMLDVVEQRMIERVLAHLGAHGVDHAVLSLGYRPDAFVAAFPAGHVDGVRLDYAVDPVPLDTAGAIRWAATSAGMDDTFLVVNGDVLTDLDLGQLVAFHRRQGAEATIALTPVADPSAYGVVEVTAAGAVSGFFEKPPPGATPSKLINAGAYVFEASVLGRIPEGRAVSVEREIFPAMVSEGRLSGLATPAYWIDAGTPATYLQACLDLVAGLRPGPPCPGARALAGGLWVTGSPILDGSVAGPSLVADAAFVAAGASVMGSVVATGARVEAGATVSGSMVLAGAVVAAGASVQRSIVGRGARVGQQAVVAELTVVGNRASVPDGARLAGERAGASR